jgi:glycosidase
MPSSLYEKQVSNLLATCKPSTLHVTIPGLPKPVSIKKPYPSPLDWRDHWIYFLVIDRFNNTTSPPNSQWDRATAGSQGGTFEGVREKLSYIKDLGAGAIWLTPVLKNVQFPKEFGYHGYGIMDFLEVDPRFGTTPELAETEFTALVNEIHGRGLYLILDVVINHAGDLFAYDVNGQIWDDAPWLDGPYAQIYWRDRKGVPRREWTKLPKDVSRDEGVWPQEFQNNEWFRRQGKGGPIKGDFDTLKEFKTEFTDYYGDKPVWNLLIRAHQYIIAKFDIDGFRIDTLKHVSREFALTFSNAIREFAFSIGKKNFFIFGEAKSNDERLLASYTGRFTSEEEGLIGADAVLDFPLQWKLVEAVKGFAPPTIVEGVFDLRKKIYEERPILSTHGEASRFFVTFLDNHDDLHRFLFPWDGGDYSHQVTLALGCLFCLQGIPCIYYGTEQGLKGTQELYEPDYDPRHGLKEHVREALWGKPNPFDQNHTLYKQIKKIAQLRMDQPALRYGRQYFRQVSGNNEDFGFSVEKGGIIAFSRILNDREVMIVANTNTIHSFLGWVVVDSRINRDDTAFQIAYSNLGSTGRGTLTSKAARFHERNGSTSDGWARRLQVSLAPIEIQIHIND